MRRVYKIIAIFSFVYFLVLALYTSFNISLYSYIWLLIGVISLAYVYLEKIHKKDKKRIPLYLYVGLNVVPICGILIFIILQLLIFSAIDTKEVQDLDYVIVLGARVRSNIEPSSALKKRLDMAYEYACNNPDTILVLSGTKSKYEPVTEAEAMAKYLMDKGIDPSRLYLEIQSKSTKENIIYSKALIEHKVGSISVISKDVMEDGFGKVLFAEDKPKKIGIVTSDFHCFRAKALAHKAGFDSVYTMGAITDPILYLNFSLRESIAILLEKFMGNI